MGAMASAWVRVSPGVPDAWRRITGSRPHALVPGRAAAAVVVVMVVLW